MGGGGKKGGSQTIGYKYYLGYHAVVCHGPIDTINRFRFDERLAWEGKVSGGTVRINKPELFGGKKREGGVSGKIDICMGALTQPQNAYLVSKLGSLIPAYRGVVSLIFNRFYWGNNPYLKPWDARGTRIFIRQNGIEQWYPAKAGIPWDNVAEFPFVTMTSGLVMGGMTDRWVFGEGYAVLLGGNGNMQWYSATTFEPVGYAGGTSYLNSVSKGAIGPSGEVYHVGLYNPPMTGDVLDSLNTSTPDGVITRQNITGPGGSLYKHITRYLDGTIFTSYASGTFSLYPSGYIIGATSYADGVNSGRDACLDDDGNIWIIFQVVGASDQYMLGRIDEFNLVVESYTFTGGVARGDVLPATMIYYEDAFRINGADGYFYVVDRGGVLLDTIVTPWGGATADVQSGGEGSTFWIGFSEYSLIDASLVRTVNPGSWPIGFFSTVPTGYDPTSHALWSRRGWPGANPIDIRFLDRGAYDMNPAHIIREGLTDPDWGMGYTDADIDNDSFTAAADLFFSEGLGMSLLWDKQITIEAFINLVQRHVDTSLYVSRQTGKFVLKPIRGDYDVADLLSFDETNIASVDNPVRVTTGELVNSVTVTYWNQETSKDTPLSVMDTALVQQQNGSVIDSPVQYPGFSTPRNATIAAQRDLRVLSSCLLSCTIVADSSAQPLNPGDCFLFSWSKWGLVDVVMRVTGIAYGTGRDNRVRINAVEDVFSADQSQTVIVVPDSEWIDPSQAPTKVLHQMAQEAPYYALVQLLGQTAVDTALAANNEVGRVMAAAAQPTGAINADVYTNDGDGYEDASSLDFCPFGTLSASLDQTTTSFILSNGSNLDLAEAGTFFQIGDEIMRLDSISETTGTVTVGRGVLDTVPQKHLAGEEAFFWQNYYGGDPTEYVALEEIGVKVVPASGMGTLPVGVADAMTVTLMERAFRPYPPGDLRINGDSYLIGPYEGNLEITWTDRDRLLQTSTVLVDHTEGNIGPEAGTTYNIRGYVNGIQVFDNEPATTGTVWLPPYGGLVKVEVYAKRDGVYSLQAATHEFLYATNAAFRVTEDNNIRATEDSGYRTTEG